MTTATQTLSDFLLARIAEDEAAARAAIVARDGIHFIQPPDVPDMGFEAFEDAAVPAVLVGPERVLAQCAAFRAIVEEHGANQCRVDPCDAHDASFRTVPCPTLRALASIWRDHDEFQEAWL